MTRSIFDPTGGETERSGSRFLGPDPANISHLPPDALDGEVAESDELDAGASGQANELSEPLATDSEEAARRLAEMDSNVPHDSIRDVPPPAGA